jgi:hypothetical protein
MNERLSIQDKTRYVGSMVDTEETGSRPSPKSSIQVFRSGTMKRIGLDQIELNLSFLLQTQKWSGDGIVLKSSGKDPISLLKDPFEEKICGKSCT